MVRSRHLVAEHDIGSFAEKRRSVVGQAGMPPVEIGALQMRMRASIWKCTDDVTGVEGGSSLIVTI